MEANPLLLLKELILIFKFISKLYTKIMTKTIYDRFISHKAALPCTKLELIWKRTL